MGSIFVLYIFLLDYIHVHGQPCPHNLYGSRCEYPCQCKDPREQCDDATGSCASGCADGWIGPSCQYTCNDGWYGPECKWTCSGHCVDNDVCDKADGHCLRGCAAGWIGDRCATECRDGTYGYRCYGNCSSHCLQGRFCNKTNGHCDGGCSPRWKGDTCSECNIWYYGIECQERCSGHCIYNEVCDKVQGHCQRGCAAGWMGDKCDAGCDNGTYGINCTGHCSSHCLDNGVCDKVDGHCPRGCDAGWIGDTCERGCDNGTYGINCSGHCSGHCVNNSVCDKEDGHYPRGCAAGWMGDKCERGCDNGTYGINCTGHCIGHCMDNSVCDKVDGHCPRGCDVGWMGDTCERECRDGTYGYRCYGDCSSHCLQGRFCNKTNGHCDGGCSPRWKGDKCSECDIGYYGLECQEICSGHCRYSEVCDKVQGHCLRGCSAGWMGDKCDAGCDDGTFGMSCTGHCSSHCMDNSVCDKVDGHCPRGCDPGWRGDTCERGCDNGTYGINCSERCSGSCMNNSVCDKEDGHCPLGCDAGLMGDKCERGCNNGTFGINCSGHCSGHCIDNSVCDKVDGHCPRGCAAGWMGDACARGCDNGTYGNNCTGQCRGHCLDNSVCDKVDGHCPRGCVVGWMGDTCERECDNGTYGINCSGHCSGYCVDNDVCYKVDGHCPRGCAYGWIGYTCHTVDTRTEPETRASLEEQVVGSIVVVLVVVSLVFQIIFYKYYQEFLIKKYTYQGTPENKATPLEEVFYLHTVTTDMEKSDANPIPLRSTEAEKEDNHRISDDLEYIELDEIHQSTLSLSQHCINVSQLMSFSKSYEKLVLEFEEIPTRVLFSNKNAIKHESKMKNRSEKTFAYDCNRMILNSTGNDSTDYINASYIDGYKRRHAYIAAQGPTKETIHDFWRLIWQEKIQIVVMVTNLYKNEKMKCEQYWDPLGPATFGDITVTVVSEEQFAEFTIRAFKAQSAVLQSSFLVKQYHYTAWPDKACPAGTASLLCFWGRVNKDRFRTIIPWLVHCSSGAGRTGTFIALDILISQGLDTGFVDVYECVETLRQQRVFMVEDMCQYIYLHELLVDALVLQALPISKDRYLQLYNTENVADTWNLCQQADYMSSGIRYSIDKNDSGITVKTGLTKGKISENRDKSIIPESMYRSILPTSVDESKNFIRAVFMPSYCCQLGFILTQTPYPTTTTDWWKLVYQYEIQTVLAFDDAPSGERMGQYLPHAEGVTFGPFLVDLLSNAEESSHAYVMSKYRATYQGEKRVVTHITYKQWSCDEKVPSSSQALLQLCQEVIGLRITNQGSPLLIQCHDGATRSGLMAVILYALERLRIENEVAIVQILRHLRQWRAQIVPNKEQFCFVHTLIKEQIENN